MIQILRSLNIRAGLRSVILLSASLFYLGVAYIYFDVNFTNLARIEAIFWLLFSITTLASIMVGASRLRSSYLYFFENLQWFTALKILTSASLVGQIFSSFFAGIAHRVLNPTTRDAGSSNIILVAMMEKLATFGIIASVGLIGLFMTDNLSILGIEFNLRTILSLGLAIGLLLTIFCITGGIAYFKTISNLYILNLSFTTVIVILNAIPIFFIIFNFADLPLPSIYFLTSAVMFAAALPISANGLGMREAAVLLFLGPEAQDLSQILTAMFALSITIFILNLLLPLGLALINIKTEASKIRSVADNPQFSGKGLSNVLSLTCALSVPVLGLIQLEGVIASNKLTISPGDLFAVWTLVACFPIMLWSYISDRHSSRTVFADALNIVTLILAVTLLYFFLSTILSLYFIGYTPYTFANKFSGLFILFGCFFSGLIVAQLDKKFFNTVVYGLIAILAVQLLIPVLAISFGFPQLTLYFTDHLFRFVGFQNNPNAFGFTVLMILNLYIIAQRKISYTNPIQIALMTVLVTSMMLSGSRAIALASLPLIILSVYQIKANTVSRTFLAILFCLIMAKSFVIQSNDFIDVFSNFFGETIENKYSDKSNSVSDLSRLDSIRHGLNQFLNHPILGCGLGCAFETSKATLGTAIVPHNSFAWILGDLGLVGLIIVLALPIAMGFYLRQTEYFYCYCMFLSSVTIASMFHEFFYQRFYWIVLGVYFALAIRTRTKLIFE